MATKREPPPPPRIGKYGNYTIFITPKPKPKPKPSSQTSNPNPRPISGPIPKKEAPFPPIQVPPQRFEKPSASSSSRFRLGLFWEAVAKVQNVHSSLDELVAAWLGLHQSKYQWALNDYYQNNAMEQRNIAT